MVLPFLAALAPFAPIIGGAISAVGALSARKPKPVTTTVNNSIDLVRLRDDAEKAGFNPLTIIRGGGLAGYGTTVSTGSAGADTRLSDALQTFGSGVAQWQYDPYGEAKSLSELALAKAQIDAYSREGNAPANLSFGGVPKSSGVQAGKSLRMGGVDVLQSPDWADAQDVEDRYGDVISSVYGLGPGIADAAATVGFRGDKLLSDLTAGAVDFARYLDKRKVQTTARPGLGGATWYTGGGF